MPRPVLAVLLIAVALAGCDGGNSPAELPPDPEPATIAAAAGAYALAEFNGASIPYTTHDHVTPIQSRVEVIGGMLTVDEGGTYSLRIDRRLTTATSTLAYPQVDSGAVSRHGDSLTFTSTRARPAFPGRLVDGKVTVTGGIGSRTGMSDQLAFHR